MVNLWKSEPSDLIGNGQNYKMCPKFFILPLHEKLDHLISWNFQAIFYRRKQGPKFPLLQILLLSAGYFGPKFRGTRLPYSQSKRQSVNVDFQDKAVLILNVHFCQRTFISIMDIDDK